MKILSIGCAALMITLYGSCEKRDSQSGPTSSKISTLPTEPQLLGKKRQLESEVSEMKNQMTVLERDIAAMQQHFDEIQPKLKLLEAEKMQMVDDWTKLSKRWEKETAGIHCELSSPIHEMFRDVTRKMDQLLQENQEMKQKLEDVEK